MHATVVQYLHAEVGPRLFGNGSAESNQEVFCAAAGLTEMAGWMAHDAGQDGLAQQRFARARDLSKLSGDPELSAHIFASLSHLANHLGRPAEAIKLAQAGQAKVRSGPRNPELDTRAVRVVADFLAYSTETIKERMWLYHWLGSTVGAASPTSREFEIDQ